MTERSPDREDKAANGLEAPSIVKSDKGNTDCLLLPVTHQLEFERDFGDLLTIQLREKIGDV